MTGRQRTINRSIQVTVLLSLLAIVALTVGGWMPFQQIATAARTVLSVATDDPNDMVGLGIICAGAAVFVMSDRRRRSRGRQASS